MRKDQLRVRLRNGSIQLNLAGKRATSYDLNSPKEVLEAYNTLKLMRDEEIITTPRFLQEYQNLEMPLLRVYRDSINNLRKLAA